MIMLVLALLLEIKLAVIMDHLQYLMPARAIEGDILVIPNCKAFLCIVIVLAGFGLIHVQVKLLINVILILVPLEAGTATIKDDAVHWLANKVTRAKDTTDPSERPVMGKD